MNTDLRHFQRVMREYGPDEERQARIACVASITAIALLIVANITPLAIENWRATFAAPSPVPPVTSPQPQATVAASMPAATPIFEARPIPMSSPVQCSGKRNKRGWISHAGDRQRTGRRCV